VLIFLQKWGNTATVAWEDSGLPWDIDVYFPAKLTPFRRARRDARLPNEKRVGASPPVDLSQRYIVEITAGTSIWSNQDSDDQVLPYCDVGGWDNGDFDTFLGDLFSLGANKNVPFRQMDCRFEC